MAGVIAGAVNYIEQIMPTTLTTFSSHKERPAKKSGF